MNITITTFTNPFSFYCKRHCEEDVKELLVQDVNDNVHFTKHKVSDVNHGQYIAVLWNNKWVRGIVTLESQFLIWLIDYGIYLRPNDKTVYIDQPAEFKKYPTKIFEASIHGVAPLDKILSDDCQIKNVTACTWNKGSVEKAQALIASACKIYLVPIALLSTSYNNIVIGDLYLKYSDQRIVNIVNELEMWPIFLEKNKEIYIKNLSNYYITRTKHRASLLKPELPNFDLPTMTLQTSLTEYNTICEQAPHFEVPLEYSSDSECGSTVIADTHTGKNKKDISEYKLTPSEMEDYAHKFVHVHGREYNVLNTLLIKIQDLKICERYKDYEGKSVGRAFSRKRKVHPDMFELSTLNFDI